jgi:hypothetical protein
MTKTNKYKVEKIYALWYVLRLHYVGWWIFEREDWQIDSIGHFHKKDANSVLKIKENK